MSAIRCRPLVVGLCAALLSSAAARGELLSYASEIIAAEGVAADALGAALGPPDYVYTEGVFVAGARATFTFPAPLDDVAGHDLILYAFVTGSGSDRSVIKVEARAARMNPFVTVATIDTAQQRQDTRNPFGTFDHVHHFEVDFQGYIDKVTEVRITNLEGDELKLDAVEGIHPALQSPARAVEMRIFRLRDDFSKRFQLRFKNLAGLGSGQGVTGFVIEHTSTDWIDQTDGAIVSANGEFSATPETTAGPDNGPRTQRTEYAWQGMTRSFPPGAVAAQGGAGTIDTDVPGDEFLENFVFTVKFEDGTTLSANWNDILAEGAAGQLFALYEYPPHPVSISEPRPAWFYEFIAEPAVAEDICTECGIVGPVGFVDADRDEDAPGLFPGAGGLCGTGIFALGVVPLVIPRLRPTRARRAGVR